MRDPRLRTGAHKALSALVSLAVLYSIFLIAIPASGEEEGPAPTIASDREDYYPGETVTLTGANWEGDTTVRIVVNDDAGESWKRDVTVDVAADGTITDAFALPDWFVAVYTVTATGQQTARVAKTTFTDGALDWTQCRNDSNNDNTQDDCEWSTGSLGSNNSIYTEGEVVPHRQFRLIDTAGAHYVVIDHSFYDSSKDAYTYDFFATPDATLGSDLAACEDLPSGGAWSPFFGGGATSCDDLLSGKTAVAIPTESTYPTGPDTYTYPFVAGAEADAAFDGVGRDMWISCGAIVGGVFTPGQCSGVTLEILGHTASNGNLLADQDGPPTSDDFVAMKVSFTTLQPNTVVAIWIGAHLAKEFYWNRVGTPSYQAKGAATAAGASFHVRLQDWDENSAIGNRDNQMQTGAVVPPAIKSGYKWNDLNGNGVWDRPAETGLPNWRIYVDYDDDGVLDLETEPYDDTDADGYYEIPLIRNGTWKVREVHQDRWKCTFPANGTGKFGTGCYHQETFAAGNTYPDNNFGNFYVPPDQNLVVTKTANTSLTRTYEWTIAKTPDGEYWKFIGDPATSHGYTVAVDRTATDSAWAVSGTISITNPDTPTQSDAVITGVSDLITPGDIAAAVTCPVTFPYTLPKGQTLECTYSAALPNADTRTNTATVTTDGAVPGNTATASVNFASATVNAVGPASIDVTDTNGEAWTASDDASWNYSKDFTCSTDPAAYTNGAYSYTVVNTAAITQTGQSDTASVTVHCYAPVVSKTAETSYTRKFDWTIQKDFDGSYDLFAGQSVTHGYKVAVDQTVTEKDFAVAGTITVVNPNPNAAMPVTVADSVGGTAATLDCGGALNVLAGGQATCDYSASLASKTDGTNTATVTFNGIDFTASKAYAFGDPTNVVGYPQVTVTDTNVPGTWGPVGQDSEWPYNKEFTCPTDASLYTNGVYTLTHVNTATIVETDQSDIATVTVNCYLPSVSKTAAGTYDERHEWDVEKTVDPESQSAFAGEQVDYEWKVTVTEEVFEEAFSVTGTITVSNPSGSPLTVGLVDELNDVAKTPGVIGTCSNDATYAAGELTIPANTTTSCSYSATPAGRTATENVATITMPDGTTYEATDPIEWAANVIRGEVTLDDDQNPAFPITISSGGTWTYEEPYTCSSDVTQYAGDGTYTFGESNTATIKDGGTKLDESSASTAVDCYAPLVSKDAATSYTRTFRWTITKAVAPTSHTGFAGDSFQSDYDVDVTRTMAESAFAVTGKVYVSNPHPTAAMTVDVADSVGGAAVTIDCGDGPGDTSLTIPAGGSASCDYSASLASKTDGTNTATVTLNQIDFTATAPYAFGTATVTIDGYETVDVTDAFDGGAAGALGSAGAGSTNFSYPRDFVCPTDEAMYTNGVYTHAFPNTAEITQTGQQASANVDLTCYLPAEAKVVKTTVEGPEDIGQFPFTFKLYDPSGVLVETKTLGAAGEVTFDRQIKTEGTWTIVEVLPAGWVSTTPLSCTFVVDFPGSAGTTYSCTFNNVEKSRVTVLKKTGMGVTPDVDPSSSWTFSLWAGPDGFGVGSSLGSANTSGDLDGVLEFGVDLDPTKTYTLCEESVPAGWVVTWMVNGAQVFPYNPNANDSPPADVGNRCVDLGATPSPAPYPIVSALTPGDTLEFEVSNYYPGGEPRTPGYWKNWSTCTGGGQAENAARNGGWEEGFWLIDNVIDPSIPGAGITWDDILSSDNPKASFTFPITACKTAVSILDARDVVTGKKMSSDAAYTLARSLLAAQANFIAGARTCPAVLTAATQAETLLDKINFTGTGSYLKKGADYTEALRLHKILDDYNNGGVCVPPPTP